MADSIVSHVASESAAVLPCQAVNSLLSEIEAQLWEARELMANSGEMTHEMLGALAMIEKTGALTAEALMACGGTSFSSPLEWAHRDKSIQALAALKACKR